MKRAALPLGLALLALYTIMPLGCGGTTPEPKGPDIGVVDATVVVETCPDSKTMNAKAAHAAIQKLVEKCSTVPNGNAHFSTTLMPGGRIMLASPSGNPDDGVVPTCVLSNQLTHRVYLRQPCKFDVKLEERKVQQQASASEE
ncbi:hypothetical protein [Polyangium jinanense]|uniref:Lipoprotein n=1 Tax=Polyangium jinanense TaxID=2829994 RepID=A0A9X3X5Q5_9BACT|nr:hypothetical protein [Polyangium jinanense]MDC3957266.1 hypothetical protein [Polyangium jinanense]MDC3982668.1 hypothetical protein [Polyangium jinanense]